MRRLAIVVVLTLAGCGRSEPPPSAPPAAAPPAPGRKPVPESAKPQETDVESIAKAVLEDAERRATSAKPDVALSAFHDVAVRFPSTAAGRRALARCVELETEAVKTLDREFEPARTSAEALLKQGHVANAIASLTAYAASTVKEPLKRRAEAMIERYENEARRAYVEAVRAARKPAASKSYDDAAALLKAASERSTPEVKNAAERDLAVLEACRKVEEAKRSRAAEEAALAAFGDRAAHLLKRLKERAYTEVLKDFDAAIADPSLAPCRERLTADRAAVAAAAAFWDGLQKSLKARLSQEVLWRTADSKLLRGTLKKIHETGLSVRLEGAAADTPLDTLHPDQLLAIAIHPDGLPEKQGASYAASAMWFFLEGRQAESKVLLATAGEMDADLSLLEVAWRRGFFRLALAK